METWPRRAFLEWAAGFATRTGSLTPQPFFFLPLYRVQVRKQTLQKARKQVIQFNQSICIQSFFFLAPDKTDYFWHVCPVINAYLEVHVTLSVPIFMHNPLERKKATERRGNTQKDRPLSPSAETSSCSVAYPYRVPKRQTSNYSRVTRY